MVCKTKIKEKNNKNILFVAKKIKDGDVVALPTETVYGLAGRFDNDLTIKKIFSIKNINSESGAERLRLVSMHAGEVSGAVLNLSGTLSSL